VLAVLTAAACGASDSEQRVVNEVLTTPAGMRPAARDMVRRPGANVRTEVLARGGGVGEQVFVHWQRDIVANVGTTAERLEGEQGIRIWESDGGQPTSTWRVVYARRYPWYLSVRYQIADVTRDGHDDVLVEAAMGSAGCGSWRMIASVAGTVREILARSYACEIGMWIGTRRKRTTSGDLVIREPVGRCPYRDPSAHCFGGSRTLTKRWNGRGLVTFDSSVKCVLPRLDSGRGCA
jgi:hypothetical protein